MRYYVKYIFLYLCFVIYKVLGFYVYYVYYLKKIVLYCIREYILLNLCHRVTAICKTFKQIPSKSMRP